MSNSVSSSASAGASGPKGSGAAESLKDGPSGGAQGSRFARAHHFLLYFIGAVVAIWLLSGFYQVGSNQEAIVERLGQYLTGANGQVERIGPGLNYHLPWPIDRVSLISTSQKFTLKVNAFHTSPAQYEGFKNYWMKNARGVDQAVLNALFDPYVITGDKSLANIDVMVNFSINDPAAWLQSVSHEYQPTYDADALEDMRNALFQQIAQRAIISQVARMKLEEVIQEKRAVLQRSITKALQEGLAIPDPSDSTGKAQISLGVSVQEATISYAYVPDRVKLAYEDLNTKKQNAQTEQRRADADATGYVAKAQGEVSTMIAVAESYKQAVTQAAAGEVNRFRPVLQQYEKAPDVTMWNVYVDALQTITKNAKRMVLAQPGQKTVIMLDPPQFDANQTGSGK
jgi:modulator of FtsH protease HflK